jgi:Stress responsive A/B Barrel Domain
MNHQDRKIAMGAIAHIVTWRLNGTSAQERAEQAQRIMDAFKATQPLVPGLLRLDIGPNAIEAIDAWDLGAYMVFASRADLEAYQCHPSHLAIKALVGPMRSARAQVDFELSA